MDEVKIFNVLSLLKIDHLSSWLIIEANNLNFS